MTNLSLIFGLLLILCSVVLNARRPDGISIHQDELAVTVYNGQFSVCKGDFSKNRDYYLKVTVGKQHKKTSIICDSNDMAQWNEILYLNAGPGDHDMLVELYDQRTLTPDHCLGHLKINIADIDCERELYTDHHQFLGKKGDPIGSIRLAIKRNSAKECHNIDRPKLIGEHHEDLHVDFIDAGPNCDQNHGRTECIDVVPKCDQNDNRPECIDVVSKHDLEINIVEAHLYTRRGDLFGKPEYYLRTSVGGKILSETKFQQRSTILDRDDEEICDWNEFFTLNNGRIGHELLIQLMDHDTFTQDDCIGEFKINIRDIECSDAYHNIYDWRNETIGYVRVIITRRGIDADMTRLCIQRGFKDHLPGHIEGFVHHDRDGLGRCDDSDGLGRCDDSDGLGRCDDSDGLGRCDDKDSKYNLVISVLEAEVYTSKGDWITKPDLYVKASFGKGKHSWKTTCKEALSKRSRVIHNSDCTPHWDEKLFMNISRHHKEVLVELMDHDTFTKDDCLGSFTIDIDDISMHDGPIHEREFVDKHGKTVGRLLLGYKLN